MRLAGIGFRVALLLSVILAGGCTEQQEDPGLLVIGKTGDLTTLDPASTPFNNDYTVIALAYDQLFAFVVKDGQPTGEVTGELAEFWESDESGKVWTFTLRREHFFDDGSPVTSAAVKFTFERILRVGRSPAQTVQAWLKEIEVLDDLRFRIHLNDVYPFIESLLALTNASIVNPAVMKHAIGGDNATAWLSENTAGSGPYRLMRWDRGERLAMAPNPHAAKKPRQFDRIVFRIIPDAAIRRIQLEKGDIDIMEGVTQRWVARLDALESVKVITAPSFELYHLWLNTQRPPLDDIKLRQALRKAIDYEGIIANLLEGNASAMRGVLLPGIPGYDPGLPPNARDLEGAKRLLRDGGYESDIRLGLLTGAPDPGSIAETLQSNFSNIDVRLDLLPHHAAAYQSKLSSGDFDMALGGWYVDFPDPWALMNYMFVKRTLGEGGNYSFYVNERVDDLLTRAASTVDPDTRIQMYRDAQRIIDEESPIIFLYAVNGLLALRQDLKGLNYNMSQQFIYNAADMYRAK